MDTNSPRHSPGWLRSRSGLVLLAFLGIVGFFLVKEHAAHVLGILPYLLFLACPLLHFFHRGNPGRRDDHAGGHSGHGEEGRQ